MAGLRNTGIASVLVGLALCPAAVRGQDQDRSLKLFEEAVRAMGGETFLAVRDIVAEGVLYYLNREGDNSNRIRYNDYTKLPDKSRYEEGNNRKARDVVVFNLEKNEGWILEGQRDTREATPEEMKDFRNAVKHSLDTIFRFRYKDPQNKLFYLGPGEGADITSEAVKLLDPENDEVTVYFDRNSKLPVKIQYQTLDRQGVLHRYREEYSQWHRIQGVNTPLRIDVYDNNRRALQRFVLKIAYNTGLADSFFVKPVPPK